MRLTARAVAFTLLTFVAPVAAGAQQTVPATVTVTGQGEVRRPPQSVTIRSFITTNDDAADHATSANQTIYDAIIAKLGTLGIDAKNVHTDNFSVNFIPRPNASRSATPPIPIPPVRYGYIATRSITITGIEPEAIGRVADAVVGAGATSVNTATSQITSASHDEAYRAALVSALGDATAQAQALANAAHRRLGPIVQIQAGSQSLPGFFPVRSQLAYPVPLTNVPTSVTPGDVEVRTDVIVTYALR